MATDGNFLFAAAIAIICIYRGWSMEGPYYSVYGRDVQSSNSFSDPDHKAIAHLQRRYLLFGGNTNYQSHSQYPHTGNNAQDAHHFCSNYHEYNTLLQLKDNNSCLRAIDVWPLLESLSEHNPDEGPKCRVHVIQLLSAAFGNIDTSPDYCQCHGYVKISNFPNRDYQTFQNCWNIGNTENNYYQKLYSEYYNDIHNYYRQCTHHHVWHSLSQITDVVCQRNLIINLAYTFRHYVPELECSQAIHTCDKYATVSNLVHRTVLSHPAASDCSPNDHRASEALVFQLCHTNDIRSWIKGAAVLENCSQIPLYAPVATFIQDSFIPNAGQAGIFLGCLPNGFKLAAQECFANATVLHIEKGGLYTRDPYIYHVVLF